jgi:ABC-type multidrug transport system ATPase subunit
VIVELDSIEIAHGSRVVFKDFSHGFEAGCHAIVGRNGVGKSTLLSAISGSNAPRRGRVLIDGLDLYVDKLQAKRRLCYVPDTAVFYPFVTGHGFLSFVLGIHRKGSELGSDRYSELLQSLGLEPFLDTRFSEASLGTRVKLYLLAAFLVRPSLLVMDEPFNGLDSRSVDSVVHFLKVHGDECAVVFSTHNAAVVEALDARRLVLDGEPNRAFKVG